jgi:hypothetical protein
MIKQCWDKNLDQRPKFRRITKRLLEATSDCRHTVVQANKDEQVGAEYLQEDRPPSIRNLFLASPKSKRKKNFRISKVDLTLHLLQDPSDDATVGTDGSKEKDCSVETASIFYKDTASPAIRQGYVS